MMLINNRINTSLCNAKSLPSKHTSCPINALPSGRESEQFRRMRKTGKSKFAAYPRLNPLGIGKDISAADLIEKTFLAYNGGRLREAARLLAGKMLPGD